MRFHHPRALLSFLDGHLRGVVGGLEFGNLLQGELFLDLRVADALLPVEFGELGLRGLQLLIVVLRLRLEEFEGARRPVNGYGLFQIEIAKGAQNARGKLRVRGLVGHLNQIGFPQWLNLQLAFECGDGLRETSVAVLFVISIGGLRAAQQTLPESRGCCLKTAGGNDFFEKIVAFQELHFGVYVFFRNSPRIRNHGVPARRNGLVEAIMFDQDFHFGLVALRGKQGGEYGNGHDTQERRHHKLGVTKDRRGDVTEGGKPLGTIRVEWNSLFVHVNSS